MIRYLAFLRLSLFEAATYRWNAMGELAMESVRVIILWFFWHAVHRAGGDAALAGFTLPEMVGYVFLSVLVYTYTQGDVLFAVSRRVRSGAIAADLVRPVDFQLMLFFHDLGSKLPRLLAHLAGLTVALLFFSIPRPGDIMHLLLFAVSLFLAGVLHFSLDYLVSLVAFSATNVWGLSITAEAIFELASGAILPLVFFPEGIRQLLLILPWAHVIHTPVNLFLGRLHGMAAIHALLQQAIWCVTLFLAGRWLFGLAVRRVTVHGG